MPEASHHCHKILDLCHLLRYILLYASQGFTKHKYEQRTSSGTMANTDFNNFLSVSCSDAIVLRNNMRAKQHIPVPHQQYFAEGSLNTSISIHLPV
jgi:hypothetical protein